MSKREVYKKAAELWIDVFTFELGRDKGKDEAAEVADTAHDRFIQKASKRGCSCGPNEGCSDCPD